MSLGGRVLVACDGAEKQHILLRHAHISCRCLDDISKRYLDDILRWARYLVAYARGT